MRTILVRIIKIVGIFLLASGFSAGPHSCSGPAEFTNGLPKDENLQGDERLLGWWHGPHLKHSDLDILLIILPAKEGTVGVLWYYPGMGSCWAARVYPSKIGEIIYYDGVRVSGMRMNCEDYTEDGATPGHIIVQAEIDESDRLFLRFVRNGFFNEFERPASVTTHVAEVSKEKHVVDKYLVVEISSDDLIELIRNNAHEGLFAKKFGPFNRITSDRERGIDRFEPWREK